MCNEKKKKEIKNVEGFLKTSGIKAKIKPFEKPDIILVLQSTGQMVGIEVREHFNDEIPHELFSQGQRLLKILQKVQDKVEKLKSSYPQLKKIYASFHVKKDILLQARLNAKMAGDFAGEIVDLVLKESEVSHSNILVIPEWKEGKERRIDNFKGYPLMEEYVNEVNIRKGFYGYWCFSGSACHLGVNTENLCKIIQEKNMKAKSYKREGLNELWLLIAAPHDNPFNAMHSFPELIDFHNQKIMDACNETLFDKIFFWSSPPHEWYRQIWPMEHHV